MSNDRPAGFDGKQHQHHFGKVRDKDVEPARADSSREELERIAKDHGLTDINLLTTEELGDKLRTRG
jgi:hypothetical protein